MRSILAAFWLPGCGGAPQVALGPPALQAIDRPDGYGHLRADEAEGGTPDLGEACATLCWLTSEHCRHQSIVYASLDACTESCLTLPALGLPGDTSGNSVYCRVTYALLASSSHTLVFCLNAAADGGTQCR